MTTQTNDTVDSDTVRVDKLVLHPNEGLVYFSASPLREPLSLEGLLAVTIDYVRGITVSGLGKSN